MAHSANCWIRRWFRSMLRWANPRDLFQEIRREIEESHTVPFCIPALLSHYQVGHTSLTKQCQNASEVMTDVHWCRFINPYCRFGPDVFWVLRSKLLRYQWKVGDVQNLSLAGMIVLFLFAGALFSHLLSPCWDTQRRVVQVVSWELSRAIQVITSVQRIAHAIEDKQIKQRLCFADV